MEVGTLSNSRRVRRGVAAGLVGVSAIALVPGGHAASAAPAVSEADQGPILWRGTIPEATADAGVVAQIQALSPDHPKDGTLEEVYFVGRASSDGKGNFTVRAAPGDWFKRFADGDGRVEVVLTATSNEGRRFGLGLSTAQWSPDNESWTYDPILVSSGALGDVDPTAPPSSPIVMSDATPEMLKQVEQAKRAKRARSGTRSSPVPPSIYACYGSTSEVIGYNDSWMAMGKYSHSGVGPDEDFRYQRTTTTSTSWGYKASTAVGVFSVGGNTTFASQTTSSTIGGNVAAPDGSDKVYALQVNLEFQRRRYTDCWYADQPPAGGGTYGFDVNIMRPYRWEGDVIHSYVSNDRPTGGGTDVHIYANSYKGRASGESSDVGASGSVTIGSSLLNVGVTYTSSGGAGTQVTRIWHNNSSSTKYINGQDGHPLDSGATSVWAHG